MRQWLVKFLGGFTFDELYSARNEAALLVEGNEKQITYYQETLIHKDKEIARLTDLMLTRAGFIIPGEIRTSVEQHQPINRKPSWPQRQRELEKEDAKRFADETERRWKEKPGALPEGTERYEPISGGNSVGKQ